MDGNRCGNWEVSLSIGRSSDSSNQVSARRVRVDAEREGLGGISVEFAIGVSFGEVRASNVVVSAEKSSSSVVEGVADARRVYNRVIGLDLGSTIELVVLLKPIGDRSDCRKVSRSMVVERVRLRALAARCL